MLRYPSPLIRLSSFLIPSLVVACSKIYFSQYVVCRYAVHTTRLPLRCLLHWCRVLFLLFLCKFLFFESSRIYFLLSSSARVTSSLEHINSARVFSLELLHDVQLLTITSLLWTEISSH